MYLIHAQVRPPDGSPLPESAGRWVRACALAEERVEHVAVHVRARPYPVLGVYLLADCLEQAEARTADAVRRALDSQPALRGWVLIRAQAPLVAPFYERLMDGSATPGHNRPRPDPSN